MTPRKRTSPSVEELIVLLRDEKNLTYKQIGEQVNMGKAAVWKVYRRMKNPAMPKKRGRPRLTDERTDRKMLIASKKDPKLTAPEIKSVTGVTEVSTRTIQRRLAEKGLHGRVAAKKPYVSKRNMAKRLKYAKDHLNWTVDEWKKVLWTDESKFNLIHSDGIRYVRRPVNTRFKPRYTIGTVKHSGGNIMIWGAFHYSGVGPLYRISGKMDQVKYREIMENVMLPYANENIGVSWVYQQDNDPKHTAKSVKKWFSDNGVRVMEWPAQSPDLNPIENLWGEIERLLKGKKSINGDKLFDEIYKLWNSLPIKLIHDLIESIPKRCLAVIKAKGGPTKY